MSSSQTTDASGTGSDDASEDNESVSVLALHWSEVLVNDLATVMVATDDDVVVGWLLLTETSDPDLMGATSIQELADIAIHPDFQRLGHGSRLLHAAVDTARSGGITALVTWCPLDDEPRRAFLMAHGFVPDSALRDLADEDDSLQLREVRLVTHIDEVGS
jgi:GNAT superfamily N-acetyltransferase